MFITNGPPRATGSFSGCAETSRKRAAASGSRLVVTAGAGTGSYTVDIAATSGYRNRIPGVTLDGQGRFTLAECYVYTTSFTSWMQILFGDPLYRPFAGQGVPVPVPTLTSTTDRVSTGWRVQLESDVPVRSTLYYTTDGTIPSTSSPSVAGPTFYARRSSFAVPSETFRYVIAAKDPTGRESLTPSAAVP